jgi:hypothetical protein
MSEPGSTTQDGDTGPTTAELAKRQDTLDSKLDTILAKLTPPTSHAQAQQRTEDRLSEGQSVAEQVQAELAKAEKDRTAAEEKAKRDKDHEDVKAKVAALSEAKPVEPLRRVTRFMFGSDPKPKART